MSADPRIEADPDAGTPPPVVIEYLAFKYLYDAPYVIALVLLGTLLCLILAALLQRSLLESTPEDYCISVALAGVTSSAVTILFVRRAVSRQRQRLTALRGLPAHLQAARMLPTLGRFMSLTRMQDLMRQLVADGHVNMILRFTPLSKQPPIAVQFEPIPWETAGQAPVTSAAATALPDVEAAGSLASRLRRILARKGRAWWLPLAIIAALTAALWSTSLRPILMFLLLLNILIAILRLMIALLSPYRRTQWWLVPGGIVRRRIRLLGGCDIRLFRRSECVLAAYQVTHRDWSIAAADARGLAHVVGTRDEVDFALRALCSPLPPPTEEMLRSALS